MAHTHGIRPNDEIEVAMANLGAVIGDGEDPDWVDATYRSAREEARNLSVFQLKWQARRLRRQTAELHVSGVLGPAERVALDAVRDELGARGAQVSA